MSGYVGYPIGAGITSNDRNTTRAIADIFNITGACKDCGRPVGTLKPAQGLNTYKMADAVVYHIGKTMQSTRMGCD